MVHDNERALLEVPIEPECSDLDAKEVLCMMEWKFEWNEDLIRIKLTVNVLYGSGQFFMKRKKRKTLLLFKSY